MSDVIQVNIRQAEPQDLSRVAEIMIYNFRRNYYPIFRDDDFYFRELQVTTMIDSYFSKPEVMETLYVAEHQNIILGFMEIRGAEIGKLYVDSFFQNRMIGEQMLRYAVDELKADFLWALEKNEKARRFYNRHGFEETGEKMFEEDTTEYLLKYQSGR